MVSLQLPKSARKEKPRLFYGMYLLIKIIIQRCLYVSSKDDHQKKEKFMNINLPDHSLHAAFCHAIRSWNKRITESLTFGNNFCKLFSYYEFLFQLVFTPDFEQRHIPRYKYIKRQQQNWSSWNRQEQRGASAEWKNCEILLFPTADRRFDTKVKCPTGRASFWVKFSTVRS